MNQLTERITRLFERYEHNRAKAVAPTDIPLNYEAMTPEWLTHVLCKNHLGAKVTGFTLGEIDNGSTNRRRVFLSYNDRGQMAGLPGSVFCKASHALVNRLGLGLSGAAHGETVFYNEIRPLLSIEAPRAFLAVYDPESFNSMVMLEDMAGEVEFGAQTTSITWERAVSMVKLMANYHATMHEYPKLLSEEISLPTWQMTWSFSVDFLSLEEASHNGFRAAEEVIPKRLFARSSEIWQAMTHSVAVHDHLPRTLLHCDTHLKNWYVRNDNRMGLMDWQLCCIGNWSRDFAYAISVALATEDRRVWERELLSLYLDETRANGGPAVSFDEAWASYRQQLFTALAWWTITLRPPPVLAQDMQPPETALEFIGRITRAIDDLESL